MPLISSFYGILIYMFKELKGPHNKPHIHAVYAGAKLTISFDGEIFAGSLPRKQQKPVEV
ncbi:MAG: DUF4160 domain-containing protein [Actinobacteria bacterium]|nr:DUF4160 domain-containing protein [Actinomycetota bacterium]